MSERNIINGTTATGLLTVFYEFYQPLMPFLVLALVMVLVDLNFGIAAAKRRRREAIKNNQPFEDVRLSRAGRRTINKLTDYICWVTLAGLFGQAFGTFLGIPTLAAGILVFVYGLELSSCFANFFEARGKKVKVNIWAFLKGNSRIIEFEEEPIKTKDNGKP